MNEKDDSPYKSAVIIILLVVVVLILFFFAKIGLFGDEIRSFFK